MSTPARVAGGHSGVALAALVPVLVVAGAFLRIWGIGSSPPFGDEVHSLAVALGRNAEWLAPYHPLGLYNRVVMATVGIDEIGLRLPALVPSLAGLGLAAWLLPRFLPQPAAVLALGWIAFSPYLVYLGREARSYPLVMLLFWGALLAVWRWLESARATLLVAAALASALAVWLHPACAPSVAGVALLAFGEPLRRGQLRARRRSLALAGAAGAMALALLVGPRIGSVAGNLSTLSAQGQAGFASAWQAWQLGIGLGRGLGGGVAASSGAVAVAGLVLLGALHAARSQAWLVGWAALIVTLQLGAQLVLQPTLVEVGWVFLRYCAHLLPALFVLAALGLTTALCEPRRARLAAGFALVLPLAFAGLHARAGHYGALDGRSFDPHPISLVWPDPLPDDALRRAVPRFYREVLPELAPGPLVEAPAVFSYPLASLYERAHGRRVFVGVLGEGFFQGVIAPQPGVRFRQVVSAAAAAETGSERARYLVVHKHPAREVARASAAMKTAGLGQRIVDPRALRVVLPERSLGVSDSAREPVYEDSLVAVYDLDFQP